MSEYKVYTIDELKAMPVGEKFEHQTLGKCTVQKGHVMKFDRWNIANATFKTEGYPWDRPMRRLTGAET
jgi:hypothetical protein